MRHTLLLLPTMAGALRKVLVTGANKGIGKRIATRILTDVEDSFVYLGARDADRGAAAVADILAEHPEAAGRLELLELDTESDASVQAAAAKVDRSCGASAIMPASASGGPSRTRSPPITTAVNASARRSFRKSRAGSATSARRRRRTSSAASATLAQGLLHVVGHVPRGP